MQAAATLLFIVSRVAQIAENARAGGTGTLALLTLIMNAGGSAARIFTAAVEVRDRPEVLISFVISTVLNTVLLAQYAYYALRAPPPRAAAAVADKAARGGKRGKAE